MNGKRSIINIISGASNQIIMLLVGIIMPRLVLVNLGSEVNGLVNSVHQIFTYFTLLEAGVGVASVQALYKTVGDGDRQGTNGILSATSRFYRKAGFIYLLAFAGLIVLYPLIVPTGLDTTTICLVILFSGLGGLLNYFFQAKYNVLLQAEGKNYISHNLSTCSYLVTNAIKLYLLLNGYGIVAVQGMYCLVNTGCIVVVNLYIRRNYPWIDLNAAPDYQAISQRNYVLIHRITKLIFYNTDTTILTLLCGLETVSVYAMYNLILGMVNTMLLTIKSSFFYILGQTFHKNREEYLKLHDCYETYSNALTFAALCIAGIFTTPFMKLYTAGITDADYIDIALPYLFIATFLLDKGRDASQLMIEFAQHFKQTRWRAITEAVINLTISILCVRQFGIRGVLFGTAAALFYRTNDIIWYANRKIAHRSVWRAYRSWLLNLGLFIGFTLLATRMPWNLDSYLRIIFWAGVSFLVVVPVFTAVNSAVDRESWKMIKEQACGALSKYQASRA